MSRPKVFRDPVHGQLTYERFAPGSPGDGSAWRALGSAVQKVIDCREFQRLRHIRQNGLANLAFHGAEHSRFTHSMGVAFLAREMFDRITRNMDESPPEDLRTTTCLAALLHDVGHGPFSHTIEEILDSIGVEFDHERMTVRLIEEGGGITAALSAISADLPASVAAFIDKKRRQKDHWSYRLVSSQLDADRLDYLMRDAQFAGLRGHGFDLPRLLDNLHHLDGTRIAVHRKALEAAEAYALVLDQMYRAVYYHHTVRAASFLLSSVLRRAVELFAAGHSSIFPALQGGRDNPMALLTKKGDQIPLDAYVSLGEFQIWHLIDQWQDTKDPVLSDLCRRLLARSLFKAVDIDLMDHSGSTATIDRAQELTKKLLPFVTDNTVGFYVGVDTPSRTSYRRYDWRSETPDESIWIADPPAGKPFPIEENRDSKIVAAMKDTKFFPRLICPEEVRHQLNERGKK
jgi:HD superfamily phosphohydrolase